MPEPTDQFTSFTQKVFTTLFGILIVAGIGWAMSAQTKITTLEQQKIAITDILVNMQVSQRRLEDKLDVIDRKLDNEIRYHRVAVQGLEDFRKK